MFKLLFNIFNLTFNNSNRRNFIDCLDLEDDGLQSKNTNLPVLRDFPSISDSKAIDVSGKLLFLCCIHVTVSMYLVLCTLVVYMDS